MITVTDWIHAMAVVAAIYLVAMLVIVGIWRLAKRDEEDRRLREEGPNYPQTSKFDGTAH